jgi:hypothetical protein
MLPSKGDIDFEYMMNDAGQRAGELYDRFWSIVGNREVPDWNKIVEQFGKNKIDEAREYYHNLQVVKDIGNDEVFGGFFFFGREMIEFVETKGDYVQQARRSAVVTYAVVKDGKWFQKGDMGWWGMSFNEKEEHTWVDEFHKLIDSVPDDTLFSLFDCHI